MNIDSSRILGILAATLCCLTSTLNGSSVLLGVSGDGGIGGGVLGHTLFIIDTADASTDSFLELERDGDGESIAWHPGDQLLYRGSGNDATKTFWSVELQSKTVTQIPLTGPTALSEEFVALTHDPATGDLFATFRGPNVLRSITTAGAETDIGPIADTSHGLAMVGGLLLSANNNNMNLIGLNPADGSTTNTFAISTDIVDASGFTGLARNPDDGSLWGVVRVGTTVERHLVKFDTLDILNGTGSVMDIGDLGNRFSGLAFVPQELVPEPSTSLLGGLALLGISVSLRRRR